MKWFLNGGDDNYIHYVILEKYLNGTYLLENFKIEEFLGGKWQRKMSKMNCGNWYN